MQCGWVWGSNEFVVEGRRFNVSCKRLVDDGLNEVVGPQCALSFLAELDRFDCLRGWFSVGLSRVQVEQKGTKGYRDTKYFTYNNHESGNKIRLWLLLIEHLNK